MQNNLETSFHKAKNFLKNEDYDKASKMYKDILHRFPKNKKANQLLMNLKEEKYKDFLEKITTLYIQKNFSRAETLGTKSFNNYENKTEFLRLFGTIKGELGKLGEAENIFLKLMQIEKNNYITLANLGNIYYLQNNFSKAAIYFKQSIELNSNDEKNLIIALNGMGLLHFQKNELQQAQDYFQKILNKNPKFLPAYTNIGNVYKKNNMLNEAEEYYLKGLEIEKRPELLNNIGTIYQLRNKFEIALNYYTEAIKLKPNYCTALINRGTVNFEKQDFKEAIRDFKEALKVNPNSFANYNNIANVHFKMQNYDEAIKYYENSISNNYFDHNTYNNLGNCYIDQKKFDKALECFDQAISIKIDFAGAYNNKGTALWSLSRFNEAKDSLEIAFSIDPKNPRIPLNMGNISFIQQQYAEAIKHFEDAISLRSDYAEAYFNIALIKLLHSDFTNGLKFYEWRLKKTGKHRIFKSEIVKKWNGKDSLKNKTIIILAEQGLGDTIQFCRFVKRLIRKDTKVILKVQDCLVDLISSLSKDIEVVGNSNRTSINDFDFQIPLMSLPYALNMTYKTLPRETKYLSNTKSLVKKWNKILKGGFKIGIAWQGSNSDADRYRSFSIKEFDIFHGIEDVSFYSLQKDLSNTKINENSLLNVYDFTNKMDLGSQAFLDTAAIVGNLDLVITCDTSIGHLAGALNCPTWIVLGRGHDWRWFFNDTSVWYPSVRLFRQNNLEDWSFPFSEMKKELKKLLKTK